MGYKEIFLLVALVGFFLFLLVSPFIAVIAIIQWLGFFKCLFIVLILWIVGVFLVIS